jgi:hypothetical protein
MYFPYFRGKQNELILLRENSELISSSLITPIIEPVKSNFKPILKCINTLIEANVEFILIANPSCGELVNDTELINSDLITSELLDYKGLSLGYILDEQSHLSDLIKFTKKFSNSNIALIHAGFINGSALSQVVNEIDNIKHNIFIDQHAKIRYRSRFRSNVNKVLIRDGFNKKSNREYPSSELFSELHITYEDEGVHGFGDFLISGEEFSDSGGPAYAVAIHLTYLEPEAEGDMYVNHFVSDRKNTPADPGGKFLEALKKLIEEINTNKKIFPSRAIDEFIKLYVNEHFPGLGVVKKLSMQHHVELIADYLGSR